MTKFRPCIDLHEGKVKQIVGGTLEDAEGVQENHVSDRGAAWFAERYREDQLEGGHVIMLGSGNEEAARGALAAYPTGLQIGGGITRENAATWLDAGASHVVVTSYLFDEAGVFQEGRLQGLVEEVGSERLVLDLSCRTLPEGGWRVAMNRWKTPTDVDVSAATLDLLAGSCSEFLVHAADVEGKCGGIDTELVAMLGAWSGIPITYAGGARSMADLEEVDRLSAGSVDLTIGSALDIFGGGLIDYADCVAYNRRG
ncbi:MAG: phosphoribosylformimino-5-aminoimidazole carboxamide ribotide isomerase [Pseudoalteromonas tetraodonis]|jgi:phosphoribosylformimino-5-aminoimidazole carboxamide ribotide isomerase